MNRKFKIIFMSAVILAGVSILSGLKIFGIMPNYVFTALLAVTVIEPDTESVVTAACSGLALDLLSGCMIGMNALLCMYFMILCVLFVNMLYIKKLRIVVPMCFVMSFLYELLFGIFSTMLRGAGFAPLLTAVKVLPAAAFNTLIFLPMYIVLSRLRFEKKIKGIKYEK